MYKFSCQNDVHVRKNEELKSVRSYPTLSEVTPVYGNSYKKTVYCIQIVFFRQ